MHLIFFSLFFLLRWFEDICGNGSFAFMHLWRQISRRMRCTFYREWVCLFWYVQKKFVHDVLYMYLGGHIQNLSNACSTIHETLLTIVLTAFSQAILRVILYDIYTGNTSCGTHNNLVEVYDAATKYGRTQLAHLCSQRIYSGKQPTLFS